MLFDKTDKPKNKSNVKKGVCFLFLSIIVFTIVNLVNKLGSVINFEMYLFYFILGLLIFNSVEIIYKKNLFNKQDYNKKLFLCILAYGFCMVSLNYFFFKALTLYSFAIVYKVFSFENSNNSISNFL